MGAGVGYEKRGASSGPSGGTGPPTVPEDEPSGFVNPVVGRGDAQVGGAASTMQEEYAEPGMRTGDAQVGGAARTVQEGLGQAPRRGPAIRPKTEMEGDVEKPLAGWLVVLRSNDMPAYQDVPIFRGRNMLGRDSRHGPHCIGDGKVSGEHALILADEDGVQLTDLGSSNGTVVNNKKVKSHVLKHGDMVKLGKTTLVFVPMPVESF